MEKKFLPHFTLQLSRKPKSFFLRVLFTKKIPRKKLRSVDRSRLKRVVREFFRQKRTLLPWKSVICRVDSQAAKIKNAELFQELNQIL